MIIVRETVHTKLGRDNLVLYVFIPLLMKLVNVIYYCMSIFEGWQIIKMLNCPLTQKIKLGVSNLFVLGNYTSILYRIEKDSSFPF